MSLLDRLSGIEQPNIAVHQFWASMKEMHLGKLTQTQVKATFNIVGGTDLTEWDWLVSRYTASVDKALWIESMHSLFLLAESRLYDYHTKATMQARILALA